MKTGFNLLLWTGQVEEEHFPIIEDIAKTGYDGVEVPLFGGSVEHYKKVGQVIKDNGMKCTAVTVIPDEEHNPISANANHRKGGVEWLQQVVDWCAALEAETLLGPFHSPLGVFTGSGATEDEKARGAEVHREIAGYAQERNVTLALEYLNRFECYFLNTMADAVDYVKRVNHPNFGTMYDTFHANIEEKDPFGVIAPAISHINHVHISENDRGTPGEGHIDMAKAIGELKGAGYDGWLTIEAFGRALPDLAAATRVWRDFFPSQEHVYKEGIKMLKETWANA